MVRLTLNGKHYSRRNCKVLACREYHNRTGRRYGRTILFLAKDGTLLLTTITGLGFADTPGGGGTPGWLTNSISTYKKLGDALEALSGIDQQELAAICKELGEKKVDASIQGVLLSPM